MFIFQNIRFLKHLFLSVYSNRLGVRKDKGEMQLKFKLKSKQQKDWAEIAMKIFQHDAAAFRFLL